MEKHVTILAVLFIACHAIGIIAAIVVFITVAGGGLLSGDTEAIAITTAVGSAIAFFLTILSVPGIIGGIGLLRWASWARILVLVLGFLNLINVPFGTILGVYAIWVLMKDETARLFNSHPHTRMENE